MGPSHQTRAPFERMEVSNCLGELYIDFLLISLGKVSRARAVSVQSKHSRELLLILDGLGSFIIEVFATTLPACLGPRLDQ